MTMLETKVIDKKLIEIDWYEKSNDRNTGVWRFLVPQEWGYDDVTEQLNAAAMAAIADENIVEIDEDSDWFDFFDADADLLPEGMQWFLPSRDMSFDLNRERPLVEGF